MSDAQNGNAQLIGYPCAMRCGRILRTQEDGVAFKLRQWQFATCHACAPRVTAAATRVGQAVRVGLAHVAESLVSKHAPLLAPAVRLLITGSKDV